MKMVEKPLLNFVLLSYYYIIIRLLTSNQLFYRSLSKEAQDLVLSISHQVGHLFLTHSTNLCSKFKPRRETIVFLQQTDWKVVLVLVPADGICSCSPQVRFYLELQSETRTLFVDFCTTAVVLLFRLLTILKVQFRKWKQLCRSCRRR